MGSQAGIEDGQPDLLSELGLTHPVQVKGEWSVEKVLPELGAAEPQQKSPSPLAFFHMLERVKTTKREGWRRLGVGKGESVADHMYRMSLISMFAPPSLAPRLDLPKCMKMCLIHDMAELLVGDITPVDGVPKPEKSRREASTMDFLCHNLLGNVHGGVTGEGIRAIWQEYEDSETLDSHFVHDVDKMELLLQMLDYEKRAEGQIDLGELAYVAKKMTLPETRAWADELLEEREKFWGTREHLHGEKGVDGGISEALSKQQDDYYNRD